MLFLILLAIFLTFVFSRKQYNYWRSLNVPQGNDQIFLIGDLKDVILRTKSLGEFFHDIYARTKNNKVFGIYFSYRPIFVINDFDIAKRILTTDFHNFQNRGIFDDEEIDPLAGNIFLSSGEKWKKLRQKVTPLFSSSKLKQMQPTIEDSLNTLEKFIDDNFEKIDFDVKEITERFTMTLISSLAFGMVNDSINEPENIFNQMSLSILEPNSISYLRIVIGFFYPQLLKTFKIALFKPETSTFFSSLTRQTFNYRKLNSINRNDFIQLFMELHDKGEGFTMDQVTANALLFVLAGYETTASTITFCLYEISKNIQIQRKIQSEIDKLENDSSYEKLKELKFIEKCVEETLRKYPIVPILNRECENDYELKEMGVTIPRGTPVIIPIIGIQRDPERFNNPLEFNPDRDSNQAIPFGFGQRSCPGNRMGMLVTKLMIVKILSKFNLDLVSPTTLQLSFSPKSAPLTSKEKIMIKFSHR